MDIQIPEDEYDDTMDRLFGIWLREQRNRTGLSIMDVCDYCDITIARLCDLESGECNRSINEEEVEVLSDIYGIDPELFYVQVLGKWH